MNPAISIAIVDLVDFACRSGDLAAGPAGPTAIEGIRAHQKLQKNRAKGYRAEVKVSGHLELDNTRVELSGRVDLLKDDALPTIIEEIKTCYCTPDHLPQSQRMLHWAQLKIYGFCHLSSTRCKSIRLQMTWYDLIADATTVEAADFSDQQLAEFTSQAVARYLRWHRFVEERKQASQLSARQLSFPFDEFRPGQRAMAAGIYRSIRDAGERLIEAPTGIGKTVSGLFPAIKALGDEHIDKIIYLTAKNSGRQVAADTLDTLVRAGLDISSLLIRAKKLVCPCRNGSCERDPDGQCPLGIGFFDRLPTAREQLLRLGKVDGAALDAVAREHQLCPFELSLQMLPWVSVVICDYNYVFDPLVGLGKIRESGKRTVLLLDEAHNLVTRSRQMYSARLSRRQLDLCARACKKSLPSLGKALQSIDRALVRWQKSGGATEKLSLETPITVCRAVDRFLECLAQVAPENNVYPEELTETLREIFRFKAIAELFGSHHVCLSRRHSAGMFQDIELKLLCLDASAELAQSYRLFHSTVLFSGTLSPAAYYRQALGVDANANCQVLPSPFTPDNLGVFLCSNVDTRYHHRERYLTTIARIIHSVYSARPGNYLVFFSSYQFMQCVAETFAREFPDIRPCLQERDSTEEQRAIFLQGFDQGGQMLGFAIMGGIYGEGIDYAGDRLIGAIVVGVGLPAFATEQELIRKDYQASGLDGFDFAYRNPGMARVLQAAGRVIRSDTDRGVIVLIDQRFQQPGYRRIMPDHWNPELCPTPQCLSGGLARFWRSAERRRAEAPMRDRPSETPGGGSRQIETPT